ncbi:MAG: hypothetical protein ACFFBD_05685, partial [Candidatus Hodarchaeota archaeon]
MTTRKQSSKKQTTEVLGVPSVFTSTWRAIRNPLAVFKIMIGWGLFSVGIGFINTWESFFLAEYIEASSGFIRGDPLLALTTDAYGVVIGVGSIAFMVAAVLAGTFSDSIRTPLGQRIPFIIIATVCSSLVLFGAPIILERYEFGLLAFCIVVGLVHFFLGIGISPWNALLADLFSKQNRAWAALINSSCAALGVLIGLVVVYLNIIELPELGSVTMEQLSPIWYACG